MEQLDNTLRAAVKALREVIEPAVDPEEPLAREQLRLVVDALEFTRSRLDHLHGRARFDVRHHLSLARAVADDAAGTAVDATLREGVARGSVILERPGATVPELREASAALAAALRELVREVADGETAVRDRIDRVIVAGTAERVVADRAWYLPQGLDPEASTVQSLGEALGVGAATESAGPDAEHTPA